MDWRGDAIVKPASLALDCTEAYHPWWQRKDFLMVRVIAALSTVAIFALLIGVWALTRDSGGDTFAQCRSSQIAG